MEPRDKLKNIKDLEHNNLLNKQNIILILTGTAIISLLITKGIKDSVYLIGLFILIGIFSIIYFNRKLKKIIQEISQL